MELWAPFTIRRDGPSQKQGYQGHTEGHKQGAVFHSAEGYLPAMLATLDDPNRLASWTFSNPRGGPLLQHYHLRQHTWANGSLTANLRFFSVENAGVAGEPLTPSQIDNLVEVTVWAWDEEAWPGLDRQERLWEHREMVQFGAAPTACPSGRIPWDTIIARSIQTMARLEQLEKDVERLQAQALKDAAETERWRTFAEAVIGLHQQRLDLAEATVAALHPEGAAPPA